MRKKKKLDLKTVEYTLNNLQNVSSSCQRYGNERETSQATGLACAAQVVSNDKARTHKKMTKLWFKKKKIKKKKNCAFSGRCTAFPKALLLKNSALHEDGTGCRRHTNWFSRPGAGGADGGEGCGEHKADLQIPSVSDQQLCKPPLCWE